jgi:hypothetical protein
MNNRHRLIALTLMAGMLCSGPALADYQNDIVRQLEGMGFARIDVSRTLLGRVRIVAAGEDGTREIILNPNTGEILRDLWMRANGRTSDGGLLAPAARSSGRSSESGRGDDDRDNRGDDRSGKGGGSSGSNSSGSNSGSSGSGKGGSDKSSGGSDRSGGSGKDDGGDDDED